MKLLVIAATGNLGKAIVNAALRDGHDVSVLVRDGTKVPWNGEQLTKVYVSASGSLGDQVAIALAGDTFDAVALAVGAQAADAVRTAARTYPSDSEARPVGSDKRCREGTKNRVEANNGLVDSAKYLCGTTTSKERLSSHRERRVT